ncbi:MAG: peptide-methionine (S)-S-oxide reductase MsrA [Nitrososphaerota archaeon]|nr:peptide-methionine (S)-S-oxide reductase MsrA [Nitrososphaerota archaeon]
MSRDVELATLGGGCFWCTEAVFSELRGIEKVESGYSGGTVPYPSYEEVCTGDTGHAEVVQLTFDPTVISYREILDVFFSVHDPTTLNRQGPDVGTQYRSVIFFHTPEQKLAAEGAIKQIQKSGIWDKPIVTQVEPYKAFYKAEDYHQQYFKSNANQPYCSSVIAPKVAKFRKHYLDKLRK